MKRKFVLRLLATVMAAALVVTGVPGTALTGIGVEAVYASTTDSAPVITDTTITLITDETSGEASEKIEGKYFALAPHSATAATDKAENLGNDLVWVEAKKGTGDNDGKVVVEFTGLTAATDYDLWVKDSKDTLKAEAKLYTTKGEWTSDGKLSTVLPALEKATISIVDEGTYTYTGKGIEPNITIDGTEYNATSAALAGYKVEYSNNTNAAKATDGTAPTVKVTVLEGNKKYLKSSTVSKKFTIAPASLAGSTIVLVGEDVNTHELSSAYTGSEIKPGVTSVTLGDKTLSSSSDYDVTYEKNIDLSTSTSKAVVKITGKGNYTGEATKEFTIVPETATTPSLTLSTKVTPTSATLLIDSAEDTTGKYEYNIYVGSTASEASFDASKWQDSPTFTGLTSGYTYTLAVRVKATAYKNASAAQIYGTAVKTSAHDLSEADITLDATSVTYTGAAIKVSPTVKIGDTVLKAGTDYEVSYAKEIVNGVAKDSDNITAGETQIIITAKSGQTTYSGEVVKTFTIEKAPLTVKVTGLDSSLSQGKKAYDGKNTVALTVTLTGVTTADSSKSVSSVELNGVLDSAEVGNRVLTGIDESSLKFTNVANLEKNYKITEVKYGSDGNGKASDITCKIEAATGVKAATKLTGTLSSADAATYGIPLDLKISNTVGAAMVLKSATCNTDLDWNDYFTLDTEKWTVTCKKVAPASAVFTFVVDLADSAKTSDNYTVDPSGTTATVYVKAAQATGAKFKFSSEVKTISSDTNGNTLQITVKPGTTKAQLEKAIGAAILVPNKSGASADADYDTYAKATFSYTYYKAGTTFDTTTSISFPSEAGSYTVKVAFAGDDNVAAVNTGNSITLKLAYDADALDSSITDAVETVAKKQVVDNEDGTKSILDEDGEVVKGLKKVTVDGKDYIVDEDGIVETGKVTTTPSGNKVYVDATGAIVKNKVVSYKGKKYYATATGRIATNTFVTTKLGNKVYATKDGSLKVNAVFTVGKYKYYAKANGAIANSGLTKTKAGNTVFATASGKLKVNTTFKYKGHTYKANKKGVVKKVK